MGITLPWSAMVEYVRGVEVSCCWGLKVVVLGVNREDTEEKGVDNRAGAVSGINREEERRRRAIEVI